MTSVVPPMRSEGMRIVRVVTVQQRALACTSSAGAWRTLKERAGESLFLKGPLVSIWKTGFLFEAAVIITTIKLWDRTVPCGMRLGYARVASVHCANAGRT